MSDPQQPDVPPYAQPNHAFPSAPPPAQPQAHSYPQAQPQHPAQPQAYPAAPTYPAAAAARGDGTNRLGRVAFIVAVITLAVSLLMVLAMPFVYRAADFTPLVFGLYSTAIGAVEFAGSVAAIILGLISIRRPGPQLLAGIAIGISGAGILGLIVTWISSSFYSLF